MASPEQLFDLATPSKALDELKKAKKFWQDIKDLPLVDDLETAGVDWDALEKEIEAYGVKLPFTYRKGERHADSLRVMTLEAAMQVLQTWETQMVRAFVISPTKIGLGLIGGTGKLALTGSVVVNAIIDALTNPNRDKAAGYWAVVLELLADGIAPLLVGAQFKVLVKLFKNRPDPVKKALPQRSPTRTRKKARTRIAHEIRAARK